MPKKKANKQRKLTLHRETLQNLSSPQMQVVAGGEPAIDNPDPSFSCYCSWYNC